MRHLTLNQVLELHRQVIEQSGGADGVLNLNALESALAQPNATFAGKELYPTIVDKASALGFFIIQDHPFVDGNKRLGHAALETLLVLNGFEIDATAQEQERIILQIASGELERAKLADWLHAHIVAKK